MPAHKTPAEQKRLTGRSRTVAAGGRAIPEPVVILAASAKVPPAPATLGDLGRESWLRMWTAGQAWLSMQTDCAPMTRLCELYDEREEMRAVIAAEGYLTEGSMGQWVPNPLIAQVRKVEGEILRLEIECGFTPAARARLGYAEVKRVSKLDELMSRRRGSSA